MLDARLSLALSMYEACDHGADIGTDHALLPCAALLQGIAGHMYLCDVSEKALQHARETVTRHHLTDRATLLCTDGLRGLPLGLDLISITGMGGITAGNILRARPEAIQNATLVLSAHRELPYLRQTLACLGFHLTREALALSGGRYYIVMQCKPGAQPWSEEALQYGSLLFEERTPLLEGYLTHCIHFHERAMAGAEKAGDDAALARLVPARDFYCQKRKELFP